MIQMKRLDELGPIRSGGTPSRARPDYWLPGSIPWVTTAEIDGSRISKTARAISVEGLAGSSAKVFPAGTVLVAMYGQGKTRGSASILDIPASTNQACAALEPSPGFDSEYIFQVLNLHYAELRAQSNVGGQDNLSVRLVGSFKIPIPSLAYQRKIAEMVRTWDDAIDRTKALRAAAAERAREAAKQLLAPRPEWTTASLSTVSARVSRRSDGNPHTVMTISAKRGFIAQADKYQRDMAGKSVETYTLLRKGEFAYNKGNSLAFPQGCIYRLGQNSALVPSVYFAFELNKELNPGLYAHFFASGALNRQLAQRISSGVRNNGLLNISSTEFFSVEIPIPSRPEQDRIADVLDSMRAEIALLDRKIELLRTQKRGLMQRLLSGAVRVPLDDDETHP